MAGRQPDTTIPCAACTGSGRHPTAHPSQNAPCGACEGSGLSTAPYDQRRNATTTTYKTTVEIRAAEARGIRIEARTAVYERGYLDPVGYVCLISWANPEYRGE